MNTIASFTVVPVGESLSLSKYVAACVEILKLSKLKHELHANGTNIEGDWDDVFSAIKMCQQKVHDMGAQRIFTTIQVGTRTGRKQHMNEKVESVLKHLS